MCAELGKSEDNVALCWILTNPAFKGVIIGPRTVEQLRSCLWAAEVALDPTVLKELDAIFLGPGGETPEMYTW